jgi:hypothetical protein
MVYISNIIPAFEIGPNDYVGCLFDQEDEMVKLLNLKQGGDIVFFKFCQIKGSDIQSALKSGYSIGYNIPAFQGWHRIILEFNLKKITCMIEENSQLKSQMSRLKEYYVNLSKEIYHSKPTMEQYCRA